jgi:hypothetical protein
MNIGNKMRNKGAATFRRTKVKQFRDEKQRSAEDSLKVCVSFVSCLRVHGSS